VIFIRSRGPTGMLNEDWKEALHQANANSLGLVACNKLLIASTTILASICLLLAGLPGFVLGRTWLAGVAARANWLASSAAASPWRHPGRPTSAASQHFAAQVSIAVPTQSPWDHMPVGRAGGG